MRQRLIRFPRFVLCTLVLAGLFTPVFAAMAQWPEMHAPEPDPPAEIQPPAAHASARMLASEATDSEWVFHKTLDNQHPDGNEQQMLWLLNRARTDPTEEGIWLAAMMDPDVAGARAFFDVDLDQLQAEFAAIPAKPPAAFDARLYAAARAHSDYLIASDAQSHTGQLDRVGDAGFVYGAYRGNVYAYTRSSIHGHAGFNIDWGDGDGSGMQPGRGHRKAIMSLDGNYSNVGLAVVADSDAATGVGPLITTGNYCSANTSQADHFNRFLVGTVWRDLNINDQYDPGEGLGGITVQPDRGGYHAVTADSGGYAIPILEPGTYTVTFSGSGIGGEAIRTAVVDSDSMLLDLVATTGNQGDPEAITGSAATISPTTVQLTGIVIANGHDVDYYFEYGDSTHYGNVSDGLITTGDENVAITVSGLASATRYYYRLVVVSATTTVYGNDRNFEIAPADGTEPQSASGGGGGGCFISTICR